MSIPHFMLVHDLKDKLIRININMITAYEEYMSFISLDEYQECTRIYLQENNFYDVKENLDQIDVLLREFGCSFEFGEENES